MSQLIEVKVPDIGDYKDVPVIEVHVKPGDTVSKEQSLITLESDKATMDVPSSHDGIVKEVKVKVGDSISEGGLVLLLESVGMPAASVANATAAPTQATGAANTTAQSISVSVPDIGDYKNVPVIEVHVKPGDKVTKEQSLVTLESDKATMDVPSSHDGLVKEVKVKVGDAVSQGDLVVVLESSAQAPVSQPVDKAPSSTASNTSTPVSQSMTKTTSLAAPATAATSPVMSS